MPPHLRRAALWTLTAVGALAFLRAFAGGNHAAAQHLGWGAVAWTFPLLWDVIAITGSALWIGAPTGTPTRRWGVGLNVTAVVVSGLALGAQAATDATRLPDGWPTAAFASGFAVPLLYTALTWTAASVRTPQEPSPCPSSTSTPTPRPASTSASASPAGAPAPGASTAGGPPPAASSGPTTLPVDVSLASTTAATAGTSSTVPHPSSSADERRAWISEQLDAGVVVRDRDIRARYGATDGWRLIRQVQDRRHPVNH